MTQEHKKQIEDYALKGSCSPSDEQFISGYAKYGYSLAESHYLQLLEAEKEKVKRLVEGLEKIKLLPLPGIVTDIVGVGRQYKMNPAIEIAVDLIKEYTT